MYHRFSMTQEVSRHGWWWYGFMDERGRLGREQRVESRVRNEGRVNARSTTPWAKVAPCNLIAFPPSLEVKEEVELRRERQSSLHVVCRFAAPHLEDIDSILSRPVLLKSAAKWYWKPSVLASGTAAAVPEGGGPFLVGRLFGDCATGFC